MKNVIYKTALLFLFLVCSCSVKKSLPIENYSLSNCPSEGICSIEVLNNKSMKVDVAQDSTLTYTLEDNVNQSVVRFQFKKNMDQAEVDGSYREAVVFEISNDNLSQTLINEKLQTTKMLFGRFCFCRGQVGFYKVKEGTLEWTKKDKDLAFNLNFKINEVPQVIKNIKVINGKL